MLRIFIPDNEYGVPEGHYDRQGIVLLLRRFCKDAAAIHFIADMLE